MSLYIQLNIEKKMGEDTKKIKVFEMFAGYGGASFGLKKAGVDHEVVGFSEIDKFAIQCYNQNHYKLMTSCNFREGSGIMEIKNYADATKIDPKELPDFDLLTGGFPCQSFSVAGKGLGEQDTRGTLFNDIIRIAEEKKPRYMLLENVKGLLSKRHESTFIKIMSELDRIGYNVNIKVLNSKDFGIPQNRERVWFVCFRKDLKIEDTNFIFPKKEELKLFLKDILEENVELKYYLSAKAIERIIIRGGNKPKNKISNCITSTNNYKGGKHTNIIDSKNSVRHNVIKNQIIQLNKPNHSNDRVYSDEGISPTLNTMQGGDRQPFIQIKNATKQGYLEAKQGDGVSLEHPDSKTRRGRVQEQMSPTLQCNDSKGVILENLSIRKLTPTECFRLMGFLNDEINLEGLSNTQKYKLAGNGWDINLVSKIFERMFSNN